MTVGLEKINLVALAELVKDVSSVCGSTGKIFSSNENTHLRVWLRPLWPPIMKELICLLFIKYYLSVTMITLVTARCLPLPVITLINC